MHRGDLSKLQTKFSDMVFEESPQLDWKHARGHTSAGAYERSQ